MQSPTRISLRWGVLGAVGTFVLSCVAPLPPDIAAPARPTRIIVKLKASLAQEVETSLPPSLDLKEPARHLRSEWFNRHAVEGLRPLYPDLVRRKLARRVS